LGSLRVCLVEVTVVWDTGVRLTEATRPEEDIVISIVPIVVGARGVILSSWHEDIKPLRLTGKLAGHTAKEASLAAIKGSCWIWQMWCAKAFGVEGSGGI